jgi:hypothetical protein
MQIKRRALTAGATFFLAAATGHVMQNGGSISASLELFRPAATAESTPGPSSVAVAGAYQTMTVIDTATVVSLSADAAVPALPTLPNMAAPVLPGGQALGPRMLRVESGYTRPRTDADAAWSAFGLACAEPVLVLSARPGATVGLHVSAPCAPSAAVRVTIDGLAFDAATDASGVLDLDLPALSATPAVTATIQGSRALTASTAVSDLAGLRRVAMQWTGSYDLALDAFENGAGWGDPGHVQAGGDLSADGGGVILSLGDADAPQAARARIYSGTARGKAPKIEVSAEVTPRTCGRILTGMLISAGNGGPERKPISLTMPACDSLGGFVVLSVDAASVGPVNLADSGG